MASKRQLRYRERDVAKANTGPVDRFALLDEERDQCNTLFCTAERHEDDLHVDVTGYSWREPLSDEPVIARVYTLED